MKQLLVKLLFEGKEIGNASYISIRKTDERFSVLQLYDFRQINNIEIKKNNSLSISIFFKQQVYSEFEFISIGDLIFMDSTEIKIFSDSVPEDHSYNQDVIDIFKDWDNAGELSWQRLAEEKKRAWLIACLYWSGLPKSISEEGKFIIDGSLVRSKTGFYCLLGEVFFGKRGYFGQDLDGLSDCMIKLNKPTNSAVIFLHLNRIEKVLNKRIGNYTELVVNVFKDHGFKVKIE